MVESDGVDLPAMGLTEGTGCYNFANDLLSKCMQQRGRQYQFVVIDTGGGNPLAIMLEDPEVEKADLAAEPVSKTPANGPAWVAVWDLTEKLMSRVEKG